MTADEELQQLRRASLAAPDDVHCSQRLVAALDRAGHVAEAWDELLRCYSVASEALRQEPLDETLQRPAIALVSRGLADLARRHPAETLRHLEALLPGEPPRRATDADLEGLTEDEALVKELALAGMLSFASPEADRVRDSFLLLAEQGEVAVPVCAVLSRPGPVAALAEEILDQTTMRSRERLGKPLLRLWSGVADQIHGRRTDDGDSPDFDARLDPPERSAIVSAALEPGGALLLPWVVPLMSHEDVVLRESARQAFRELTGQAAPPLEVGELARRWRARGE